LILNLHFINGQVEGDGSQGGVAVLEVAQESQHDIDHCDACHALVQDAAQTQEVTRVLHVVLQWHHLNHTSKFLELFIDFKVLKFVKSAVYDQFNFSGSDVYKI
jgi:hypothetical protein